MWRNVGDSRGLASALVYLGLVAEDLGDRETSVSSGTEGMNICRRLEDKWGLAHALWALGANKLIGKAGPIELEGALPLLEESASLFREVGDKWGLMAPVYYLGVAAERYGDRSKARTLTQEALALSREVGDRWRIGLALAGLGRLARDEGDFQGARSFLEESLTLHRDAGSRRSEAGTLAGLGWIDFFERQHDRAEERFTTALTILRDNPTGMVARSHIASILVGLASIAVDQGRPEAAARLLGAAEASWKETVSRLSGLLRTAYERTLTRVRAALGEEQLTAIRALGEKMTVEQAIQYALE